MIGYKTNGDWTDVTSFSRNEIVFEGRNKEYGAYQLRKQYNNSLILALLIASSIGVLCAAIPFVIGLLNPVKIIPKPKTPGFKPEWKKYKINEIQPPKSVKPPKMKPTTTTLVVLTKTIDSTEKAPDKPTSDKYNGNSAKSGDDKSTNEPSGNGSDMPAPEPKPKEPITVADRMPEFKNLESYIRDSIQYPELELREGIEGTLYVTFVVEENGALSDIKILRGISGGQGYNDAAIKVLEGMPKWTPGIYHGEKVRVRMNLPIHVQVR
jgi:protein TonB